MNCCCLRHCHCLSMKSVEFAVSKAIRRDVLCVWKEDNEFKDEFRRKKLFLSRTYAKDYLMQAQSTIDCHFEPLDCLAMRIFSAEWISIFLPFGKFSHFQKFFSLFLKSKFLGLLYMGTRWNKLHDLKYSQYASHL